MTATPSPATRQIARAAGTVMFALALSMLTGLVRQILVANAFGTNLEIEAFAAANRVSETLFSLVAGGALASAFIPTFTTLLTRGNRQGAWKLASAIGNLILLIVMLLSVLAAIFAPQVVRNLLAPGFADNPYKEQLTVDLLRLMLVSAVIFSLSGLVMGILNSHKIFFIPALAPSMYSLGIIFGLLVFVPFMGIFGLAWGVVLGASLHLLIQVPFVLRLGGRYYPTFGLKYPPVREVGRLMVPRLLGVAVVQINFWINVWLASRMVEGSVNGLVFAFALMLMPQTIIAQAIAIAAMPTFSEQVALDRLDDMRSSLAASLRGVLLLSIPATIGLIFLRKELVILVYQRGEFSEFSTQLVAWALLWYAAGLVGHSVVEIMSRAFYAMHDTKTPVFVGIAAMSLNVIFSLLFASLFARIGWMPLGGLALANSLATGIEMIGLLVIMRHRLNGLGGSFVIKGVLMAVVGTLAMWIALWGWFQLTENQANWIIVIGGMVLGGLVYFLVLYGLGGSEVRTLKSVVQKRLKR